MLYKTRTNSPRSTQTFVKTFDLRSTKRQGTSQRPKERRLLCKTRADTPGNIKRPEQGRPLNKTRIHTPRNTQNLGKTLSLRSSETKRTNQRPEQGRLLCKTRIHSQRNTQRSKERSVLYK